MMIQFIGTVRVVKTKKPTGSAAWDYELHTVGLQRKKNKPPPMPSGVENVLNP